MNAYLLALFMYSYFNDKLPENFNDYFTKNSYLHDYNTRTACKLHLDYQRINYGKFSIKYRGAKLWNTLPENLRNQKSYSSFKKSIKIYIQSRDHPDLV